MSKRSRARRASVPRWRSWSTLIAWGVGDRRARVPRQGSRRQACADVAGGARHALLAGRSDAGRQVRQHGPDRRPAARPARASRPPGPAAGGRAARDRAGPGALALGSVGHGCARCARRRGSRVRARELHPAREPRDGGGAEHRSRDRAHRAAAGAQLPDRRGGDRTCAPAAHDGGHRAGRDDRAAGADPRAAARLPLAGGRRRAPRDGRLRP